MKKKLNLIILFSILLISGLNFMPFAKFNDVPYFQVLIVVYLLFFLLPLKNEPNLKSLTLYRFFLISSLPCIAIGLILDISNTSNALLIYLYALFPYFLFRISYSYLNPSIFNKMLFTLSLSMIFIVTLGWLIRFEIIPLDSIFDVKDAEFLLGYWGISYQKSTRNHDYIYPLVGLCIHLYFYSTNYFKRISLVLIFIFSITLIASTSRGAIIITFILLLLLIKKSSLKKIVSFSLILSFLLYYNYNYIETIFNLKYQEIIFSIFELKNSNFSNADRIIVWSDALKASITNPFGYGISNYDYIYDKNFMGRISYSGENAYLTLLVERGLLSFIFFLWFIISLFKRNMLHQTGFNSFIVPAISIYYLFNYELNSVFPNFIFFLIFASDYLRFKYPINLKKWQTDTV